MKKNKMLFKNLLKKIKENKKYKIISIVLVCTLILSSVLIPIIISATNFDGFVLKFGTGVSTYTIEATLTDDMKVGAKQTVNYKNNDDVVFNELFFHLYPNSFSATAVNKPVSSLYETKAYPNGKSYGGIEFQTVTIDDSAVVYSIEGEDNHLLKVVLKNKLYPNDYVKIEMEYVLTLPNVNHRFGYGNNAINLANFYPVACIFENGEWDRDSYSPNGDPFYSDLANYNVTITNNSNLMLASTGNLIECKTENETNTSVITARAVRDFAITFSSKFETLTQKVGNTEIKYYYYNDTNSQQSLDTAVKCLSTFNKLFTTYPYRTLSVVETNFIFGGMEYPNLVMISDNLELYDDYLNTIVHEIAHQWWYGLVGNDEFAYGWLDEGLAEYSTILFYENNPEYEKNTQEIILNARNSYILFVDIYTDVFGSVDTSMNRSLNQFATEPEYVYIAYVKGMLLFDNLREVLGEKKLLNSLKHYCNQNKGENVTPDNLIASFERVCLVNLESLFNSWITGTVLIQNL